MAEVTFADRLRQENDDIWQAIRNHPFIQDTENNVITDERLRYYFEQNIQYIDLAYAIHAIAAAKCRDELALESLKTTLRRGTPGSPDKGEHQREIFRQLGGDPNKLVEMAPSGKAYTDHLFRVAYERDTVDVIAAFTPCPWTYDVIAREIVPQDQPSGCLRVARVVGQPGAPGPSQLAARGDQPARPHAATGTTAGAT